MKLFKPFIFLLVTLSSIHSYSQTARITVNANDVDINYIFDEIRKQANYGFFFNDNSVSDIDHISINKTDVTVKEILDQIFENTSYTYTFIDDTIVINKKKESAKEPPPLVIKSRILGVVTDEEGKPLPGANIVVKESGRGTITDINGRFQVYVSDLSGYIVVSFIGFETREVEISGRTVLNIQMKSSAQELGEVVATGYYTVDKRELTSSISVIKSDELKEIGALTVDEMLVGKAAGLMVTNLSATPGAAAKIRVRSSSTFTGVQAPLWVVDGVIYEDPVPLSAAEINSFDNVNIIGNALSGLNPQDIESISVLKDASATAIYGTRAANGVIAITTKRGKVGKPVLTYQTSVGYMDRPKYSDMYLMNSKERIDLSREMYERNLGTIVEYNNRDYLGYEGALKLLWNGTYTYEEFQNQVSRLETMNTDWFGELYQPTINQQHAISVSGGSTNARYYTSLGLNKDNGVENGVGLNRITGMAKLDLDLSKNILFSLKINGSIQKARYNHSSINSFNTASATSRAVPVWDENGELFTQSREIYRRQTGGEIVYADYSILNEMENSERNINNKSFAITGNFNWKFLNDFSFRSMFSFRNTTNLSEEWITEDTYYISRLRTYSDFNDLVIEDVANAATVPFGGLYSGGMVTQDAFSITNKLNYRKIIKSDHAINLHLAQEVRSTKYWGVSNWMAPGYNHSQGRSFIMLPRIEMVPHVGLDVNSYDYKNMISWMTSSSSDIYPSITDKISNSLSVFGVFDYSYKGRYILNFNVRSDGSNAFGQYERYKFKPVWSVSSRWNIHRESFFNRTGILEELSLRTSYGFRGTMPNVSPYLLISDYGRNLAEYYPENVANFQAFPNATLRWERTSTYNTGLNYSLWQGRLSGVFDYSYSKSIDLLQARPVSQVNGASTLFYNSGSKDVQSFEMNIRSVNIDRPNFKWSTNYNLSYEKDRVLEGFEEGADNTTVYNYLSGSIYRTGFPSSAFFSYQFNGLDEQGLPTFKNLYDETNGSIDDHLKNVLVYEGSRIPRFYGGFGTEIKYKSIMISTRFSYKLGYRTRLLKLFNQNQSMPLPYENSRAEFNDRWREPGDELYTDIPVLSDQVLRFSENPDNEEAILVSNDGLIVPYGANAWWMYDFSDVRVVKGDHIRWQTIAISYIIPVQLLQKLNISSANISIRMRNIAVWSLDKRLLGQDPEQIMGLGMPTLPNYGLSLNMSF
ncbi:MAG: SusC/RagA family TonB-linked outer membrane protein [Bacteroidota bacterium]